MNEGNEMSLLPAKDSQSSWGWFGYEGAVCDRAIRQDNPAMLKECVDRGFVKPDSKMMGPWNVLEYCQLHAPKCHEMLAAL